MSGRSGDRSENETKYMQDALTLVKNMLKEEVQEDFELVLVAKEP